MTDLAVRPPQAEPTAPSYIEIVETAVQALAAGGMVIVVDDADREHEGDLILAAGSATPEQIAFVVRHSTGILCAPMPADRVDSLALPQMVRDNTDAHGTAFTVTVDHVDSGTGVSAADRARTFHALADPGTRPDELRRPGHVFPLRARPGGVLARRGHTEATVDLLVLAGCEPVGIIGEIVGEDGAMMRGAELRTFAAEHSIHLLEVEDLVRYRRLNGDESPDQSTVERGATSTMPTAFGEFEGTAFISALDRSEHLVLTMGDVRAAGNNELGAVVRVHSECLTGDMLGSLRCDCGLQLEQSLRAIAEEGCGALVYLRGHEGRGIGLASKIHAYALQDQGFDTVDANTAQGLPVDARDYGVAAEILSQLGVRRLRLITNNPAKSQALADQGLEIVHRLAHPVVDGSYNRRYLRTKRDRMGHLLPAGL